MTKIAVITALSGAREKLHDPKCKFDGVDYYAFSDSHQDVKIWNLLPLHDFTIDEKYKNRRNAKPYKIMPHLFIPGYDYYIWHDVSHELIMNPFSAINAYMNNKEIGLFSHTTRKCLYDEASELKILGYDHEENISRQISFFKSKGMPENFGLFELPVSIRKNTDKTQRLGMMWWELICKFSSRDQLSLPFCLWRLNLEVSILPGYANGFNPDGSVGRNDILPQVRNHVSSGA